MRPHFRGPVGLVCCALLASGCFGGNTAPSIEPSSSNATPEQRNPGKELLRDEIPPGQLEAVMASHFKGLGHMERYEYEDALKAFRQLHERAPGWIPGAINLAIAELNQAGKKEEESKRGGGGAAAGAGEEGAPRGGYENALALLESVIKRDPKNPYAHFCRGVILKQFPDKIATAHEEFRLVTELDPHDAHAWYLAGSTEEMAAANAQERIKYFSKALECNPYLAPALYNLAFAYRLTGQADKQKELLAQWKRLNIDQPDSNPTPGPADTADTVYGEMGRYATVLNPFAHAKTQAGPKVPPRFEAAAPANVVLPDGHRWARESDFEGKLAVIGRVRARFGMGIATFDADGDGKIDVYLTSAVVGPNGLRDALLRNLGDGRFEDITLSSGLPKDRAGLGVAAGDFDADRHIDLMLTGVGDNRLFRNVDGRHFEDVTKSLKQSGAAPISLTARWLDLDQDGDLDLYIINYTTADHADAAFTDRACAGVPNAVYRNDGRPDPIGGVPAPALAPAAVAWQDPKANKGLSLVLTPWTDVPALLGGNAPHTGLAALDIDNDRDLDLVLASDGAPTQAIINDRLGRFHSLELKDVTMPEPGSGLLVTDLDRDGLADLVGIGAKGGVRSWLNTTSTGSAPTFETWPTDAQPWRAAQATDLDLDGRPDLIGLPVGTDVPAPAWSRNEGTRFVTQSLALGLDPPGLVGLCVADLVGDPLPDLIVVKPGEPPRIAKNLGNGHHWIAIELGGHWRVKPELMRTNPHGLGTKLLLEGQGIHASYHHTTPNADLGQSVGPVVLGLGKGASPTLLHARWPDGVLQCELDARADQKYGLSENNRKTGSCPVLFTWNGSRFVCLGDFLGGGGLGYLIGPGTYSQPDRDEALAITDEQLRSVGGTYRLAITEPMDEVAYLDQLVLEVVDRPPGVSAAPDERFVPEGARPSGRLIAWRDTIKPVRATDLNGKDVSAQLHKWDRETVDGFRRLGGWIGYAEEHAIVLDFADRLSRFGLSDPLVLCLAGWVEYPYSQTNYAAATAGVALKAPSVERLREDGQWEVIEAHAGYPAGLPRLATLDLTGKLTGPRCVIRLRTNMECYWDQAFLAVVDRNAALKTTALPVSRATLGYRGYLREVSPDGRQPLLYDYDFVDPAPLARLSGRLTRYGDVAELLRADDDQLCLVGPGDEVRLEFDAQSAPTLPPRWTRSYVLRAVGYCKDADPFTASSDTIGPLPWRGMPDYPFGENGQRPRDASYRRYLSDYQTRVSSAR